MRVPAPWSQWLRLIAAPRRLRWIIVLLVMHGTAVLAGTLDVVRPAPESPGDARYDYYWELLAQALTVTEPDFGPHALRQAAQPMTERRALEELKTGSGTITVMVHGNVADYEQQEIGLRNRLLLRIDNPLQTPETPLGRSELWYDPRRDG